MAGLPFAALAEQAVRIRRLGVLMATGADDPLAQGRVAAFREGLNQLGWNEGRNLSIDWRWSGGDITQTNQYAEELVRLAPDVLLANGTPATAALKQATSTIPIVFAVVNDPVAQGFIPNMGHPGGNLTGFSFLEYSVVGKSLEMLRQIAPKTARVAVMFNPETYPYYDIHLMLRAVAQYRVPATYSYRQYVREGGLTSYGADANDIFFRSASYVDRILKGAAPGDLPAQTPAKFEIAVNLKTAKALGLEVPPNLVAVADEVIE